MVKRTVTSAGAGAAVATGMGADLALTGGALGGAVVSFAGLSAVANHSPLKSLLGALSKDLPEGTRNQVIKAVEKIITRMGLLMDKEEDK